MNWFDIQNPADAELDRLAALYKIHPLHIEDCRHRNQSAKVEEDGGYVFVVLKTFELKADGSIDISDLDLILGADFLISVQEHCDHTREILSRIHRSAEQLPLHQIFYRIADAIVDTYTPMMDHFSDLLDNIGEKVIESPDPQVLAKIFAARRELIEVRRVLSNMRDVAGHLTSSGNPLFPRELWPFLRDIYDHISRDLDMVEIQRDILTGSMDIYLSSVANRTNQVMKVLTVLSTIALPAILVSSFFGMNLHGLPWSEYPQGTLYALLLTGGLTAVLLALLKYFKWF
jgi:magnesium transporter